jgi:DNA transformation protein
MKKNTSFHDYIVQDVFADFEGISTKPMFSGWAVYLNGKVFALILQNELYFKTDENNRHEFENRGSHPFSFMKKDKKIVTSYWLLPPEIMEDKEELKKWMEKSVSVKK